MPMGTFTKKMDLQPRVAVRTPPRITPAAKAADETAAKMLRARFLSRPSGKVTTSRERPVAEAIAAPTPCTALAPIRMLSEGARPPARDESAKTTSPMPKSLRLP